MGWSESVQSTSVAGQKTMPVHLPHLQPLAVVQQDRTSLCPSRRISPMIGIHDRRPMHAHELCVFKRNRQMLDGPARHIPLRP